MADSSETRSGSLARSSPPAASPRTRRLCTVHGATPARVGAQGRVPLPSSASRLAPRWLLRGSVLYVKRLPFPVHGYRAPLACPRPGAQWGAQRPPIMQGLPRCPGQPLPLLPLTPLPSLPLTREAERRSSSTNIKQDLCSLLNLAKIRCMSYVQLSDLRVKTAPFRLGGPRGQVLHVLVLSSCPPGRCCSGHSSDWLCWQGGGRHARKPDICHLLI